MSFLDRIMPVRDVSQGGSDLIDEESLGWERWLRLMGPGTFNRPFGEHQRHYWDWYWDVLMRLKNGQELEDDEWVYLATWGRGLGKSSSVEWSVIAEGAILGGGGYTLYISLNQELSEGHLSAIKSRLEGSEVARYYPSMGNAKIGKYGQRYGWRQEALVTESGWAVAAFGLDTGLRGGKNLDQRPRMFVLDDIDQLHDTPASVRKRIEVMSRSIFPAGTSKSLVIGAQNLIHRNSSFAQIIAGKVDLLQDRVESELVPAIKDLKIEQVNGKSRIVAGVPYWPEGFDLDDAQLQLSKSGEEGFKAEYQHDFTASLEGLIVPEYDELVHIIGWNEFRHVYGVRGIPRHWEKQIGCDWGSTGLSAHPTAVSFVATASEDSVLPGLVFLYAGLTFDEGVIVDEVAEAILNLTGRRAEDPQLAELSGYGRMVMSHEAKSERDTLRRQFGLPFRSARADRTGGVSMLRHFMRVDYKMGHPFRKMQKGAARLYWIVEDSYIDNSRQQGVDPAGRHYAHDKGLYRWRQEIVDWRWRPQDLGAAGLVREVPVAFMDDAMASLRYLAAHWFPPSTELTEFQKQEQLLPESARLENAPRMSGPEIEAFAQRRWLSQALNQKRAELIRERGEKDGKVYS